VILISRLFSVNVYKMSIHLSPLFPIHTRGVPPNPCVSHTYEKGGGRGVLVNNNFDARRAACAQPICVTILQDTVVVSCVGSVLWPGRCSMPRATAKGRKAVSNTDGPFRAATTKGVLSLIVSLTLFVFPGFSQAQTFKVKIRIILVDKDLNQKPAPRLTLNIAPSEPPGSPPIIAKTNFDGAAEIEIPPGRYVLSTPEAIEFQGKKYSWEMDVVVAASDISIELSNDNAKISAVTPEKPVPAVDDLASLFKKYQNSVVTVWSELGHGTGFVVDASGLILTNQHVIGPSEYIAVQFDDKRKVEAKLVTSDAGKDVAVLWANIGAFPDVVVAPLGSGERPVLEGERVFTIGSPLNQQKILTTGVVSKVEPHVILSDININHGNSGGPLFSSAGDVIGLTTFADPDVSGPGVSGIVRIEEANVLLVNARVKMRDLTPPKPALLPVEPAGSYPIDALKSALKQEKFDVRPYIHVQGDYDVAIITPVLKYQIAERGSVLAQREKEKRTQKSSQSVQGTFRPLDDLRNWREYTGEYKPVILIEAKPKLRETLGSALERTMTASNGGSIVPARMKFKTDFYRMKLFCGGKEVQPILPGKIADVLDVHTSFAKVTDATYEGFYSYPYDAISSNCGAVTLELFSEKDPAKPVSKTLDPKTIARVSADFAPYRNGQIQLQTGSSSSKH
jgi:S1-C subfamily serine protease